MGMEKYTPNCARFFVRKKYTTFCTVRIVALWSVNKIFPESYDFAAKFPADCSLRYTTCTDFKVNITYRKKILKNRHLEVRITGLSDMTLKRGYCVEKGVVCKRIGLHLQPFHQ
jgi:hypothetical protein